MKSRLLGLALMMLLGVGNCKADWHQNYLTLANFTHDAFLDALNEMTSASLNLLRNRFTCTEHDGKRVAEKISSVDISKDQDTFLSELQGARHYIKQLVLCTGMSVKIAKTSWYQKGKFRIDRNDTRYRGHNPNFASAFARRFAETDATGTLAIVGALWFMPTLLDPWPQDGKFNPFLPKNNSDPNTFYGVPVSNASHADKIYFLIPRAQNFISKVGAWQGIKEGFKGIFQERDRRESAYRYISQGCQAVGAAFALRDISNSKDKAVRDAIAVTDGSAWPNHKAEYAHNQPLASEKFGASPAA